MARLLTLFCVAVSLRVFVFFSNIRQWLARRPEIDSPVHSWKHVLEGVHLHELGIGAYSGDLFHDSPFCLALGVILKRTHLEAYAWLLFITVDMVTGYLLFHFAYRLSMYMALDEKIAHREKPVHPSSASLAFTATHDACRRKADAVLTAYLLNPFGIAVCVSSSTSLIFWLCIALALYFAADGRGLATAVCLSVAMLQRVHTIGLMLPIILLAVRVAGSKLPLNTYGGKNRMHAISSSYGVSFFKFCGAAVVLLLMWLFISYISLGWNGQFLRGTFLYQLEAAEHKPNFGLYWYFLAEMFEHFRPFFVCIFHLLAVAPIVPAIVKYWHVPELIIFVALSWTTILSPYPVINDYAFYLSLLPVYWHLVPFTRQIIITGVMTLVSVILAPIMWHQWVETGTGNANFYYAVTLAFNAAQILLFTDFLIAHEKRLAVLEYGVDMRSDDGSKELLVIKMK